MNGLTQPWLIFDKLISPQNLAMTLALFLPFAFINFRWSKYWLLALPIYFQLILGGSINALIVIKTHYSNLLLLPLFLVFILGLAKYQQHSLPKWWQKLFSAEKKLAAIVVTVAIIYVSLTMGPILPWLNQLTFGPKGETAWAKTQWQLAKLVPPQASLLSSYAILSALSSREKIYALNYAFTGKQQLSDKDYNLTEDLEAILIDTSDLLFYQLQAQNSSLWRKQYPTGDDRLRQIIAERHLQPNLAIGPIVYFNKFADSPISLWSTSSLSAATNYQNISLENNLHFLGWSNLNQAKLKTAGELLPLSLFWQANQTPSQDWQLQLTVVNKNNSPLYQKIYPLAYGLYPTSAWQPNEIVQTNYWFWLPPNLPKNAKIQLQLIYPKGSLTLNDLGSLDYLLAKPTLSKIFLTLPAAN
ncbi:MAG: hypothetical protein NTV81_00170 [Candidatus Komeilibacteria bacterium]|nr:hypothetical protein [Candidatus Komeilibacteria bacterium]